MASPAQPVQTQADPADAQTQQVAPAQSDDSSADDISSGAPVRIQVAFSNLQSKLASVADGAGIKRSATIPYIDGQETADHIGAVAQALASSGGLTNNLLTSFHHSSGEGWGSGDGQTVAHPAQKLHETIIPKDDENAIAALAAAHSVINKIASLVGEDQPVIKTAKAQLALVGKHNGTQMSVLDFMVALQNIPYAPLQALARAHSGTKEGGHSPLLRAPKQ